MEIRILQEEELTNAAGLSRYVFDNCVKYRMEFEQTTRYVEDYLTAENLIRLHKEEKLIVWGVFEQEQMVGVSGMQVDGMITMLYILPQCFRRGYGNALLCAMRKYAKECLNMDTIFVNATPAWISTYFTRHGFAFVNKQQDMRVPFVTLCTKTDDVSMMQKKPVPGKVIAGAILGCFLFATVVCVAFLLWYI